MNKLIIITVFLAITQLQLALAQQFAVSGTVTNSEDGTTLPGVNILVKGTNNGVSTDNNGKYTVNVNSDAVLIFSYIGFMKTEVPVSGRKTIDVILEPDVKEVAEVIVTGYGKSLKTELTGSIDKISSNELQKIPTPTFESTLQGKTPGVLMTNTSGKLGEAFNIRVRGTSSISATSQPLYVVDGMIITTQDFGDPSNQPLNPLVSIDPNDIASIEVLKDASASAIYGSRASNGVVIISTKSGKKNTKSNVNLGYSFSSNHETHRIDMLNSKEYVELFSEAAENAEFWGDPAYGPGDGEQFIRDYFFQPEDTADTDWQDYMFRKHAISHDVFLNVTGGNDKSSYFAGVSYTDQEGILIKNDFKRLNARLNFDQNISKYLDISAKLSYSQTSLDRVSNDNAYSTPMQLIAQSPLSAPYLPNGEPNPNTIYFNGLLAERYNTSSNNSNRTLGNFSASLHIIPDFLTYTSLFGVDNFAQREEERLSPKTDDGQPAGYGTFRIVQNLNLMLDNYLTFDKTFSDKHSVNIVAGISFQDEKYTRGTMGGKTYPGDDFLDLDAAAENTYFGSANSKTTFLSYFSRANYKYSDRYLLSLSFRRDGSSRFGEDARFGNFYSVSAGWIVTQESFMAGAKWLSFLKPRVSYGETGNAGIPDYGYMSLVNTKPYAGKTGFYAYQIGNPKLRWEKTTQLDIGIDYGFFNNRLSGEVDYYIKKTSDMLLNRSIPMTSGYNDILENVGEMKNSGLEVILNATPVSKSLVWNISLNFTYNDNKVTKLVEAMNYDQSRVEEGKPLGFFYMPEYAGVDPDNGDALYYTSTGEKTNDYAEAEFRDVGNPNPKYFGGLSNNFSYKNFDLNIFFQYVFDVDLYRFHGIYMSNNANWLDNQTKDQLKRWQKPGDITNVPQARFGISNGNRMSSRFIQNGSYLRLKDVTLGYTLPASLAGKLAIQKLRVYLSGLNLLTITDYEGFDPEVTSTGTNRSQTSLNVQQGVEYYSTPQAKGITVGINVTF
jgi:TonB-linked SusC/RagA family outer membrane protein